MELPPIALSPGSRITITADVADDQTSTSTMALLAVESTVSALAEKVLALERQIAQPALVCPAPTTRCGVLRVYPPEVVNGPAVVIKPNGMKLDSLYTHGSTTACLQEALNYMASYDLDIFGGDEVTGTGMASVTYFCQTTLHWPPMQGKRIRIGACTIGYSLSSIGSATGMEFDSCMMVDFEWTGGQIGYGGHGIALQFRPHSLLPLDRLTTIVDSRFVMTTVGGNGPQVVNFDCTEGSISANCGWGGFRFAEINGGAFGLTVNNIGANRQFAANDIDTGHLHGQTNTALMIGNGPPLGRLGPNTYRGSISSEHDNTRGIDTYGKLDKFDFGVIDGPKNGTYAILCETGAGRNKFEVGFIEPSAVCYGGPPGHTNKLDCRSGAIWA